MSKFADENKAFISVIKELPEIVKSLGYDPVNPRLVNSRTGVYITLMAILRLPEVPARHDIISYITGKIGKELTIDPYELLTPPDYREAAGTKKLEYRTKADIRALTMINKLINECKSLNRELVNLSHLQDVEDKISYIIAETTLTFKRIVSLKEFTFGGAYLLDEDVYELYKQFNHDLKKFTILSTSLPCYRNLADSFNEASKAYKSCVKNSKFTNDLVKDHLFGLHEQVLGLASEISKSIDNQQKLSRILDQSIVFVNDYVARVNGASHGEFDPSVFELMPSLLKECVLGYETGINRLRTEFSLLRTDYLEHVPTGVAERGVINPSHIGKVTQKFLATVEAFFSQLERFIQWECAVEFVELNVAQRQFTTILIQKMSENRSFHESVERSFKFRKLLKK